VANLSAAGSSLFPDPDLEEYLRTVANLPEPSPEAKPQAEISADNNPIAQPAGGLAGPGPAQQPKPAASGKKPKPKVRR
jgi:hypothetical protein